MGRETFCEVMSGSLRQMGILRAVFKFGFLSTNSRLLQYLKSYFNYGNNKTLKKPGYDGRLKIMFLEEEEPEICWQNLSFSRCRIFLTLSHTPTAGSRSEPPISLLLVLAFCQ
jgi:hypothetical protein